MTSGAGVHYKSMFDAGSQIVAKEGMKSLFKGAGANILRGVAGAGVLSLYDKLQEVMFGKVYSGGTLYVLCICSAFTDSLAQALAKRTCPVHYTLYQPLSTIVYLARNRSCRYFVHIRSAYLMGIRSRLRIERLHNISGTL